MAVSGEKETHAHPAGRELRTSARTAGVALIVMALAALAVNGGVHGTLIVPGDGEATAGNILASGGLFRAGIAGWIVVLICDILAAWGIYVYLKPIHATLSLLGAWLRLIYTAILAIAVTNLIGVLTLANHAGEPAFLNAEQLNAHVILLMDNFNAVWSIGLIVFGGHLLVAGFVAIRSVVVPKLLGYLLILAGIGYIVVHAIKVLLPQSDGIASVLEYIFIAPMIAGELGFGVWLLVKGGRAAA